MEMTEIKSLIEDQGKAFSAFKETLDEMKGKDAVTEEKMARIEKSLDDAVEAKAALEKRIETERKEREDLELRLSKKGNSAQGEKIAKELLEFKSALPKGAEIDEEGYAAYKSAFGAFLRKNDKLLTQEQTKAMSVGSDPDGGYLVTPDTSGRIVTKVYETSPMRQLANVVSISTDKLEGIEDLDEAAAGWVGETGTRADTDTPDLGKYSIEVFEVYAQPKATQKLLDDASVDIEAWLAGKVADKLARVENAAFVTGNGVGKPRGLTSYTTAADSGAGVTWGQIGHVVSGASGAFNSTGKTAVNTLFDLVGTLKNEYLGNAQWFTNRGVITAMRKLKDDQGGLYWQPSLQMGQPEMFMGYPITRGEDAPALASDSLSLWFGDFRTAYTIVDRTGIRVLRDPYTSKPYVKFYTTKRVGGGVVNFEAIKVMKFGS
jgi:HK97 family phage major capsid protein